MRNVSGLPLDFNKEWLIVCEGGADKAFLCELIRKRGLPDFQVEFPIREGDKTGGWSKYEHFLKSIKTNEGFISKVRALLVVADNDDNPRKRFAEIRAQLQAAGGYGVPEEPLQVARSARDLPDVVIMMIPLRDQPGALEAMLLPAVYDKWPALKGPLDKYLGVSPANDWDDRRKAKMRMQCVLAATCKEDPNTPLRWIWKRNQEYHIPVDHNSFDGIARSLQGFRELIALNG